VIRSITNPGCRPIMQTPTFSSSLIPKYLLGWIGEMERSFDFEQSEHHRRVKFACTKLKGHASPW
jgi:hypothetical protein